ncbi:MAG: CDF family Co(II)/Ni(II) efflux transporter DmeF [Deltaproteobacteria bacterium]|nr:CDF family Co(II)/Ni(II) efflux transporter DmeF [Deltaproteobacteria bacterium]
MHSEKLHRWQHSHVFGQERKRPGEIRTLIVIALTAVTMVVEIAAGIVFGSMALLADGLHMASHAAALGISAFAYRYARAHARDARFSFGTGKVNALGGFSGAVLLVVFALIMVWESAGRILHPVSIAFDQAIAVAVLGLAVNGASVLILGHQGEGHTDDHAHDPHHDRHHDQHHDRHHDHSLRSAYLHVLADALTSLLAIFALLSAKYLALGWMDPLMGIVGAALVTRWSLGLLHTTSGILLDRQGPERIRAQIRESLEAEGNDRVADLHLWSIGPELYGVIVSLVSHEPKPPDTYKERIPRDLGLAHVTVEVHPCVDEPGHAARAPASA